MHRIGNMDASTKACPDEPWKTRFWWSRVSLFRPQQFALCQIFIMWSSCGRQWLISRKDTSLKIKPSRQSFFNRCSISHRWFDILRATSCHVSTQRCVIETMAERATFHTNKKGQIRRTRISGMSVRLDWLHPRSLKYAQKDGWKTILSFWDCTISGGLC